MTRKFDEKFLQRLKKQDHQAFNEFYSHSVDIFFRYIKSNYFLPDQEVEDIVSHYFVKQRDAFKKLDIKKSFSAYVWTIFKNTIKDYFKKMSDLPFSQIRTAWDDDNISFEDKLEYEENIQAAMQELEEVSRDIIYLKYIEEKSYKEIADMLMLSQDNTRQKCSRAIKQLKTLMDT